MPEKYSITRIIVKLSINNGKKIKTRSRTNYHNFRTEKLNEAIEEWKQQYNLRGTLAEIEAESGVGSDTISKIRQGRVGADLSKIQQLFAAFGLTLDETDYRSGKQSSSQTESEPIAQLLPLLNDEK